MTLVVYSSTFPVSPDELFEFHMDARNLPEISPPVPRVRLLTPPKRTEAGDVQLVEFRAGPFAQQWRARVTHVVPGKLIEDRLDGGLFKKWRHQHRISADGDGARLTDVVSFRLLPTAVGEFLEYFLVRPAIIGMFRYRHRKTRALL